MLSRKDLISVVCLFCFLFSFTFDSFGQGTEPQYSATTVSDPQIPVDDLELLLKPLTKAELVVEAEAWLELLKEKVSQISTAEIQKRQKSREIDKKEEEIEEKVEELEKNEKEMPEKTVEAEKELQDKIEALDETEAKVEELTADAQADLESKAQDELRGSEEDLKKKTEEVIEAKEKMKQAVEEIGQADIELSEKVKKIGKAEVELHAKVKEQLLVSLTKLREEQTALISRFKVVLEALKVKGGDVEEYEKYVAAVSGLSLTMEDVKDVSAVRIMVWGWLKSPEGGLLWIKNILFFLITLLIFYLLARAAGQVVHKTVSRSKKFSDLLKDFFVTATRKAVMLIGIIVALSMLDVNITPFVAGLGVAGFVLGFALQGTLSNFASGLMILIYRPYDVGHVIEAAGVKGKVKSMNLVSTTITTFDNQVVIVPNGEIWGGVITNVTGSSTRRVDMVFGISYSDDISKAVEILESILSKHDLVLDDPAPVVRLHELGDSSVNFVCRPWVKTDDYWTVYWDVTREVKERFDAEDVSIPFPQQDVHLYKTANES